MHDSRQLAFNALKQIYSQGAYTDIALDRTLQNPEIKPVDRGLTTELVYGIIRRQRSLDCLIDQFGKKSAKQQPLELRIILQIGLYQLRYLDQIPDSAAVNTAVELAKKNGFQRLSGVVNGILRQYLRLSLEEIDPLKLPEDKIQSLGILHSFSDWTIEAWLSQFGLEETEKLCQWFNQTPTIDLRVNPLKTTLEEMRSRLEKADIKTTLVPLLPQALRLQGKLGNISQLPGFKEGLWTVQDSSAQLVSHLLDPQPGETIIDACAAPGGKTNHIAELMGDRGTIWACDRAASRLRKVQQNIQRLQLNSISIRKGDSCDIAEFVGRGDRVLVDAPCSGLGTLHRHPDIRWRQTPEKISQLVMLQQNLLKSTATWVKPGGILVYATCTLNSLENEEIITTFLQSHPHWSIQTPAIAFPFSTLFSPHGWLKILPTQHAMDGFFMVKLINNAAG
ncbi:16S rRNA (cytosine(967)-C(5))-methyltransferase [Spirulina sp. 06S082]|uniref:16S rRNA (cytosine(967)-C(5))-methyltransferase n=1 Tax=Spirulina sp. 06S082 TaxID=3110248 RepID=UPI002B1FE32B|nr:16S rRNA (cytosine(967)-C(5))-methyltransferase [Spirulina sp. 06S082]MEA5470626.1 16S rRNA (cytosine(967)-C(5))-methyltransferase [Spirulina sp. 06S082]